MVEAVSPWALQIVPGEEIRGRTGKGGGGGVETAFHSQANLLSKLDRPMAKAWRAHMG